MGGATMGVFMRPENVSQLNEQYCLGILPSRVQPHPTKSNILAFMVWGTDQDVTHASYYLAYCQHDDWQVYFLVSDEKE